MRIVFMGTPDFAVPTLNKLLEAGHEVVAVITAPDRPSGRGLQLKPSPVKVAAEAAGLLVLQPEKLRNPEFIETLTRLQPDLAVVVAFRMLPEVVWSIPSKGTLNLHASLLPDYRGAAPINWAIIEGEKRSGATTFLIDHEIDTGALLLQEAIDIPETWNAGDLHDALMEMGGDLVVKTLAGLEAGTLKPVSQKDLEVIHKAPKLFRETGQIDWSKSVAQVNNLIRGLSPYPGCWTKMGEKVLKIYRAIPGPLHDGEAPGTILQKEKPAALWVATADAWLELTEVQPEGKSRMTASDWVRGRGVTAAKFD